MNTMHALGVLKAAIGAVAIGGLVYMVYDRISGEKARLDPARVPPEAAIRGPATPPAPAVTAVHPAAAAESPLLPEGGVPAPQPPAAGGTPDTDSVSRGSDTNPPVSEIPVEIEPVEAPCGPADPQPSPELALAPVLGPATGAMAAAAFAAAHAEDGALPNEGDTGDTGDAVPAPADRDTEVDEPLGCDAAASAIREADRTLPAGARAGGAGAGRGPAGADPRLVAAIPPDRLLVHEVRYGESLGKIAKANRVTASLIRRLNGLSSDLIRPGQEIYVASGPFDVEVDRSGFELAIQVDGSRVLQYTIGIGREGATPPGEFEVTSKVENPDWTSPEGVYFAPDDPRNPLGERWIGIAPGYGIHGTTDPGSIGRESSRGCIRLDDAAIEEVFDFLVVGSRVTIR